MKLSDLNILDVGNKIGLVGAVFSDDDTAYLCMFPTQPMPKPDQIKALEMDNEDWKRFLQQLDVQEVEVLAKSKNGELTKMIVRKTQRLIEQRVSWAVFRRDNYHCRYCYADGVPLTVDHLVLWEEGGPSIDENLVAACRKCNKTRGTLQFSEWLRHPYYLKVMKALPPEIWQANEDLVRTLKLIPRRYSERETRK